jgi:predicted nuclease of restriction endonuclease-like RecB superfamily
MVNKKYTAIELGSTICSKLKQIYYPNDKWADCYKKVGEILVDLKKIARKFFSDKSEEEILIQLGRFTLEDIQDMFHVEREGIT